LSLSARRFLTLLGCDRMTLRTALLLILSCLVCITATAEETKRIRLWDETPPGPASKASGDEQDMTKATDNLVGGSRIIKLGNVSAPELHLRRKKTLTEGPFSFVLVGDSAFWLGIWKAPKLPSG
jgi:hypothetical protein